MLVRSRLPDWPCLELDFERLLYWNLPREPEPICWVSPSRTATERGEPRFGQVKLIDGVRVNNTQGLWPSVGQTLSLWLTEGCGGVIAQMDAVVFF